MAMMRNSPGGKIDWNAYKIARKQIAKMPTYTFGPAGGQSGGGKKINAAPRPTSKAPFNPSLFAVKPPTPPLPAYATWDFVGPMGMTANGYYGPLGFGASSNPLGSGVFTGRVNAAAFDPTDSLVIYIATPGGGIQKTIDGGQTWTPLTDSMLSGSIPVGIAFSSITVDPNNPQILYAGSGDYDGTVTLGSGLYKSLDGGASWTQLTGLTSGSNVIRKVVVDPKNSLHLYAALGRDQDVASIGLYEQGITLQPPFGMTAPNVPTGGIYSSNDGGITWTQELDSGPGIDFSQSPGYVSNIVYNSDSTMLYASVDFRGIYRKEEVSAPQFGWVAVPNLTSGPIVKPILPPYPLPITPPITERVDVATSPNDPNTAYFLIEFTQQLSVTNDRGNSSQRQPTSIADADAWSQSYFDFTLAVGSTVAVNPPPGGGLRFTAAPPGVGGLPQPPIPGGGGGPGGIGSGSDVIYIGLHDVYKSVDNGQSFSNVSNVNSAAPDIHTDQHSITVNPNNLLQILVGNDGGIYEGTYDTNADAVNFQNLNGNLAITEVLSFASHPTDNNSYLFANNNNAQFYADGDLTALQQLLNGTGTAALINPVEPLSQYLLIQAPGSATDVDFYSNFDDKWANITGAGAQNPLPITALLNYVAYAGDTPAQTSPALRSDSTPFVFAADPQFLYSAKHHINLFDDSTRYSAAKAGVPAPGKWTQEAELIPKDALLTPNYKQDFATAISAHSTFSDTLYVGTAQGALYYSTDKGVSVKDIGSQLGVGGNYSLPKQMITGLASDPLNRFRLYVTVGGTSINTAHIWRCDDITQVVPRWIKIDGGTFSSSTKLPDIPLTGITLLPRDDGKSILVSSEVGLFYSYNRGADWTVVNLTPGSDPSQALPGSMITQMDLNASTGELNVNAYGRGIFRSLVGLTQPVSLQLTPQYFQGNKSRLTAKIDLFHTGQDPHDYPGNRNSTAPIFVPIVSIFETPPGVDAFTDYFGYDATPVEQHFVNLSPAGFTVFNTTGVGSYDFYVHIPGFLRRRLIGLNTTRPVNSKILLFAGDVNNDNVIDVNDIIAFNTRFVGGGGFTNPLLDVNGDGVMDGFDLAIIVANQGLKGD